MEENYYDILEVSKNASPEIIEKAYKTLVKKYHPDLQKNEEKNKYEEKIKKINEAYDILSNPEKRKNYDLNLKNTLFSINDYNNLYQENINLKNDLNKLKENINNSENNIINNNYKKNIKKNKYNKINLKNIINFKNRSKDLLALVLTILVILFIAFILWHIPFTKNYLINLYNNNSAFHFIITLFSKIFIITQKELSL